MFFPLLEFWIAEAHSSRAVQNQASKANLEFQWTFNMKCAGSEASILRQHQDTWWVSSKVQANRAESGGGKGAIQKS